MTVIDNRIKISTQKGADINETISGTDLETKLSYRFDEFEDIQIHLSLSKIGQPYYSKSLDYDEALPRTLILQITESELLNEIPVATMGFVNPPPFFHFYINAKKGGNRVVLFTGVIERPQY